MSPMFFPEEDMEDRRADNKAKIFGGILERIEGAFDIKSGNDAYAVMDGAKVQALQAHQNIDITGYSMHCSIYAMALSSALAMDDPDTHEQWHVALEASGLGMNCVHASMLRELAVEAITATDTMDEFMGMLRNMLITLYPDGIFDQLLEYIVSKTADIDDDVKSALAVGLADLYDAIHWERWNDNKDAAVSAIRSLASSYPDMAIESALMGVVKGVNWGVIGGGAMDEVRYLFETNDIEFPVLPQPGSVDARSEKEMMSAVIRAGLRSLGYDDDDGEDHGS